MQFASQASFIQMYSFSVNCDCILKFIQNHWLVLPISFQLMHTFKKSLDYIFHFIL